MPFVFAVVGGIIALLWIKGSVIQWKPVTAGTTLLPKQLDAYATMALAKPGTAVKFMVTNGTSNAVVAGAIARVYVENNVRKWDVTVDQVLVYTGSQKPPQKGDNFTLLDTQLLP